MPISQQLVCLIANHNRQTRRVIHEDEEEWMLKTVVARDNNHNASVRSSPLMSNKCWLRLGWIKKLARPMGIVPAHAMIDYQE